VHTALARLAGRNPWRDHMPAPQSVPADLVDEGHAIPGGRMEAMREGRRRRSSGS
jgi:bifunctional non-homologous end joining protein LigD